MRILLDHNVPRQIGRLLHPHQVSTTREMRWDELFNGELLRVAENAGFECLLTGDQNLIHQNRLRGRQIAVVMVNTNKRRELTRQMAPIMEALARVRAGEYLSVTLEREPLRRRPYPLP